MERQPSGLLLTRFQASRSGAQPNLSLLLSPGVLSVMPLNPAREPKVGNPT